ncbi:MAG: potassium transporter, partial [Spirochaetales bacterium]
MKIIITGAGMLGTKLAKELINAKYDVVVIEKSMEQVQRLSSQLDCLILNDEGNRREALLQAGLEQADFFIAVTESDEVNMISCGLVKSLHPSTVTIARVRSLEYSVLENLEGPFLGGIDHILNPDLEAARSILRAVEYGATSDILSFDFSAVQIRNLVITESSAFLGRSIKDMRDTLDLEFLVAVLLHNNHYIIPTGTTSIHEGDTLYLIGPGETLEKIFEKAGKQKPSISRVVIVGGGKIGNH